MVKSISKARIDSLLKEVVNEKGEHEYVNCWWLYHPDFLTGVDTKPKRYLEPFYYGQVFKHFEENLNKSRFLIVIGYAFRDEKVNGYIEVFLNNKNNTVVVIDPSRPNHKLLDLSNVKYIKSKTSDMEYEDLKNLVGADWQEISDDDTD